MNDEDKDKLLKLMKEKSDEAESNDVGESKREAKKLVKDLKIITAISLGKDRNKELAKLLDTDKSFASKKIKDLEKRGLIHKDGVGKKTRYRLDIFNVMNFLQSKVIITTKKKPEEKAKEKDDISKMSSADPELIKKIEESADVEKNEKEVKNDDRGDQTV